MQVCLKLSPLIRAHIIPVGLYPKNPNGDRFQYSLDGEGTRPKKKVPHGVYGDRLVCAECERRFGPWDDYAKRLFVDETVPFQSAYSPEGTPF
jgi:hypothetical protein